MFSIRWWIGTKQICLKCTFDLLITRVFEIQRRIHDEMITQLLPIDFHFKQNDAFKNSYNTYVYVYNTSNRILLYGLQTAICVCWYQRIQSIHAHGIGFLFVRLNRELKHINSCLYRIKYTWMTTYVNIDTQTIT